MTLGDKLRIAVGVYVVRGPMGGLSWHYLQYVLGLARLGHDVIAVEDSGDHEWCCYDPTLGTNDTNAAYGLDYARKAYARLDLNERWAYFDAHGEGWCGPAAEHMPAFLRDVDLFINVSGATAMRPWYEEIPHRALIDTDPGFRQIRHLTESADRALAERHTAFFTFGERFGRDGCTVPRDGFRWQPTRQPVVLDAWPTTQMPAAGAFTTIMRWDSYAVRRYESLELGMKSHSFAPYQGLPSLSTATMEMAVGAPYPDAELAAQGWRLQDPHQVAPDPWALQEYIANSLGEFTVAKHGYVTTRSGWFSERSAGYLASGRPVITQETGFGELLPTGRGLHAFHDLDTALAAIDAVLSDPQGQGSAAREIAEQHFDSDRILADLVQRAMDK
jgi:hypothetical protein